MMLLSILLFTTSAVFASDPVDTVANSGVDIFTKSRIAGQTVRQCSCREQRICVDEMKKQAKDCTLPCFQTFDKITQRPDDLRKCFDTKENILDGFLTCFENRVDACVTSENGNQISKTDISQMFQIGEKKIATGTSSATVQAIIAPIKHILDAAGDFALCVKDCFLEKNSKGFCFDRYSCQPLVAEEKAKNSFRQCTKKMQWKREAGELCECSVHAGVDELKQFCSMFKLMGRHHQQTPRRNH